MKCQMELSNRTQADMWKDEFYSLGKVVIWVIGLVGDVILNS